MKTGSHHIIVQLISSAFIFLFVYTGVNKLVEQEKFQIALRRSPILQPSSEWLVYVVPILELLLALILLRPSFRKWGLLFAALLMGVFTIYIGWMLLFMEHLPCSCGGLISSLSWKQHLLFNLAFLVAGLFGYYLINQNKLT